MLLIVRILNKLKSLYKRLEVLSKIKSINLEPNYVEDFKLPITNLISLNERKINKIYNSETYINFFNHNFLIFGKLYSNLENNNKNKRNYFKTICSEIDFNVLEKYNFIDWHIDPSSQKRCNENKFYWESFFNYNSNLDIKYPRELSRFQHIPLLFNKNKKEVAEEFFMQFIDWIIHNPIYKGVNWNCTMDVAIRVSNWIIAISVFKDEIIKYPKISQIIYKSINDHGNFIYNNLEYYGEKFPTENHYLSNVVGLIYIGAFFPKLNNSNVWLYFGIQELYKEMKKQVYSDGGNYEASAGYHRLVGELFLSGSKIAESISDRRKKIIIDESKKNKRKIYRYIDIKNFNDHSKRSIQLLPDEFYEKLLRMAYFTQSITKPNGYVFQFGDNDSGRFHVLDSSSSKSAINHKHFPKSVYYFLNKKKLFDEVITSNTDYLFYKNSLIDVKLNSDYKSNSQNYFFKNSGLVIQKNKNSWLGVISMSNGKNGKGGHNHNDKLSFEFNLFKEDIIVDGGCPYYTNYPELRNSFRSTKAHSTIAIQNIEQDKWLDGAKGLFSLEQKSNPLIEIDNKNQIIASHVGYGVKHLRKFNLFENKLIIDDKLNFTENKRIINFNLHPNIKVDLIENNSELLFKLSLSNNKNIKINLKIKNVKNPIIRTGFYSEGYANQIKNSMISCELISTDVKSIFTW